MSLSAHIQELSGKHRMLHQEIETQMCRPIIDSLKIANLKRRKLRLKERIEKLKTEPDIA